MRARSALRWLLRLTLIRGAVELVMPILNKFKVAGNKVRQWFQPITDAWNRLNKFWQRFWSNFIVGCFIAILLTVGHDSSWVVEAENMAMDTMMGVNQTLPRMTSPTKNVDPIDFTFLDIDEESYREWEEPFHIPRDKLAKLIQFAAEGDAKAIIVDVDLSKASANDTELIAFIQDYQPEQPPLLLLRTFYPASSKTQGKAYQVRPSIFDGLELSPNIFWVQPLFKQSTYDSSARYWQLFKLGCLNGETLVIPSVQLMMDNLLTMAGKYSELTQQFGKLVPEHCDDIEQAEQNLSDNIRYGERTINLKPERVGERIIYTLPWNKPTGDELISISARRITESEREKSYDLIKGRIVVIGASFSDSRDIYPTPIESMPGALIIINAIKSMYNFGQIMSPPGWVKWSIELGLIILMSWAFARFNSFRGTIIIGVSIIVILIPISFYFFKYGLWVDFAVPLLGMQIHQLIAEYEESVVARKRHKHQKIKEAREL